MIQGLGFCCFGRIGVSVRIHSHIADKSTQGPDTNDKVAVEVTAYN